MLRWVASMRQRARILRQDVIALFLAARDPRTPLVAKLAVAAIVAYVLSPVDLIPDFIPIIGLLDEIVLVPIAIGFALRLVPGEVMRDARARAPQAWQRARRIGLLGAAFVIALWALLLGAIVYGAFRLLA